MALESHGCMLNIHARNAFNAIPPAQWLRVATDVVESHAHTQLESVGSAPSVALSLRGASRLGGVA